LVVCVVVVVTGPGTVVCSDVVVVLVEGDVAQAERSARAARHGMISFFIGYILV
jgi:hypothetical protein